MKKGNIIFLNGVSSAGKSTLTKKIQEKLSIPYYHISCDDFMDMTPKHILNKDFDNQLPITQGIMHETIKLFSDKGHNVIVDDVVLDLPKFNDWMYDYVTMFENYPVLSVRVDCPVEELERREKIRDDRSPGQAKWQLEQMNSSWTYDLIVNTFDNTTEKCADKIISMLQKQNEWNSFKVLKERFKKERAFKI